MTKIIGLTGGIGSGKTTIANYFKALGIPVYIADDEARKISETPEIIQSLKTIFGDGVINNEKLDRVKVSEIVFNNPEKLQQLNAVIHPAVKKHFENWVLQHSNFPFVIKEAAILFESGSYKDCDFVITVIAPLETRIQRVIKRDKVTREEVIKRIENQWTDEKRIGKSQYVIENVAIDQAKAQANEILKKITFQ
ncbi:dephospho-CoA kinase [Flavobacterium psychrotolerans]|uniref:Dephospho-CoA kinase n=1 Tax=Flavobacterium psychrotolerans TaxID=2169410 RepID=A0A2U1JLX6_9FLAO|nr:dephospho-CoA kinase [Flavobacterium psychrotolerans]PWA06166.1 dephospho-CoA kinase [Flavobacterium psychrotolerans]